MAHDGLEQKGNRRALAALLSGDRELITAARRTFETLAAHQGPHGEIPINIDIESGRVSHGGTTGRVDADLWFIIGCGEYWLATGEDGFLEHLLPAIERARCVPGAWEFNNRGLVYVPLAGDRADEFVHHGCVLYDQLLYLQAQRTLARMHVAVHGSVDPASRDRIVRLRHLICANYWFDDDDHVPDAACHDVLYGKGRTASLARRNLGREAEQCLRAIHRANAMPMEGEDWGFAKFINGSTLVAGGSRHQGWSAAAAVIGQHALAGRSVFRISGDG